MASVTLGKNWQVFFGTKYKLLTNWSPRGWVYSAPNLWAIAFDCKAFAQVIWGEATCLQIISVISDFQIIASSFINANRMPKCCSKLLQPGVSLRGWVSRLHHHVYFSKWGYNESRQCQLQRFVVGNSLQAALNSMLQSMSYVQTFRRL